MKKKINLKDLKVTSFVTGISDETVKGGLTIRLTCQTGNPSCTTVSQIGPGCQSYDIWCPSEDVPGGGTTC